MVQGHLPEGEWSGQTKGKPPGSKGPTRRHAGLAFRRCFRRRQGTPRTGLGERMGEDKLKVQTYPAKADMARASALRNRQDTRFGQGTPPLTRDPTRTEVPRSGGQNAP